ncbi:hypothetical protein DFP72DRAFT_1039580 [Ephemerocybe angulata]|uniref:Uncharacterized protein n=1 Tax=Ephemerocybe angulata TaxID=980116 RepID=A0A8H6IHR3_9AGAR|nr:hypothetical protein DFP72DRAFT_1039580 [Tulosesus angulatus]
MSSASCYCISTFLFHVSVASCHAGHYSYLDSPGFDKIRWRIQVYGRLRSTFARSSHRNPDLLHNLPGIYTSQELQVSVSIVKEVLANLEALLDTDRIVILLHVLSDVSAEHRGTAKMNGKLQCGSNVEGMHRGPGDGYPACQGAVGVSLGCIPAGDDIAAAYEAQASVSAQTMAIQTLRTFIIR